MVLCSVEGKLSPVGIALNAAFGPALPLQDKQIDAAVANALGQPRAPSTLRERVFSSIQALLAYSYEQVRHQVRDPAWAPAPTTATSPAQTRQVIADWANGEAPHGAAAVAALLTQLCDEVLREDSLEGLAAAIANIDPTQATMALDTHSAQLMTAAWIATVNAGGF
jgi:hypothetical protein